MTKLSGLQLPHQVMVLLIPVVSFSADGLSLERKTFVENSQVEYLNLIYRYTYHSHTTIEKIIECKNPEFYFTLPQFHTTCLKYDTETMRVSLLFLQCTVVSFDDRVFLESVMCQS